MSNIMQEVQEKLKEELYTAREINTYTKEEFTSLSKRLNEVKEQGEQKELDDVLKLCEDKIAASKELSVLSLYIVSVINLQKRNLNNDALVLLVETFKKNGRDNIVEFLCNSVLKEDPNNLFALTTLAEYYKKTENPAVWQILEKIVKVDSEEAKTVKLLADHYKEEGKKDASITYYRDAIKRYIKLGNLSGNLSAIQDLWKTLIALIPDQVDFFQEIKRRIIKEFGDTGALSYLQDLFDCYKEREQWDLAISIVKEILAIDNKSMRARNDLEECYRQKYKGHSQLEEYINSSDLNKSYRDVFEAISDFERHIAFDKGSYVYHREWKVGKIVDIKDDKLQIRFGNNKETKTMSLELAINALTPLAKDHIWVLKMVRRAYLTSLVTGKDIKSVKKELKERKEGKSEEKEEVKGKKAKRKADEIKQEREENTIKENEGIKEVLVLIIKSFNNTCDMKRIKKELVPAILSTKDWISWSAKAKKILESDPMFGINPNDITQYTVKMSKVNKDEKLINEFKAQKEFFSRVDIIMKYMGGSAKGEKDNKNEKVSEGNKEVKSETKGIEVKESINKNSEMFIEMASYFISFLKAYESGKISQVITTQIIGSYLVCERIKKVNPNLPFVEGLTFEGLYSKIKDPCVIYKELKNTHLKEDFLKAVADLPNWDTEYIKLFPAIKDKKMMDKLKKEGKSEAIKTLIVNAFSNVKDYRDTVIYFFENREEEDWKDWFKQAGLTYERLLTSLVQVISITFREISNHILTTENKRLNKAATKLLFDDKNLQSYINDNNEEAVMKLYTLIDDIVDLGGEYKTRLRNKILQKYPNVKFHIQEEKKASAKGMLVTAGKLQEKQAELEKLQKVDIPQNAKEIEEARERGDLKENAEYKAAKEHQHVLNDRVAKLQAEINRAVVFDPTTATSAYISFSTVVTLYNEDKKCEEVYTILGPWESDPVNNIISYMAPLGNALMDYKVGDKILFTINDNKSTYIVRDIRIATL